MTLAITINQSQLKHISKHQTTTLQYCPAAVAAPRQHRRKHLATRSSLGRPPLLYPCLMYAICLLHLSGRRAFP